MDMMEDKFVALILCNNNKNDACLLAPSLADANELAASTRICSILIDVCVFVFFPFILDVKFVGCTSRGHIEGRSPRISPPSFCGACLYFSREKD